MKKTSLIITFLVGSFFGIWWVLWYQIYQSLHRTKEPLTVQVDPILNQITQSIQNYKGETAPKEYKRFEELYDILQKEYYSWSMVDSWAMMIWAVKAYVQAIGDPYTTYLDIVENDDLNESLQGSSDFEWIGAYVSMKEQGVQIDEVIKDGAAYDQWIFPLDIIVQVDGEIRNTMTIWDAVEKIRGPEWSEVTLLILRQNKAGEKELVEKTVTRKKIELLSVTSEVIQTWDTKIWYIEMSSIWDQTDALFAKEMQLLNEQAIDWLILDLRWNWWGYLDTAVEIVSHFLPKWDIVVTAKHRTFQDETYTSKGYGTVWDIPVVVLINGFTASAWEIIAMALQEDRDAIVVWTTTFWKWSIQTIKSFEDGSSLKYTIGKRYSPSDKNIDKVWFEPSIPIEFDAELYQESLIDNQLQLAVSTIKTTLQE